MIVETFFRKTWQHRGAAAMLLWPLSLLYGLLVRVRRCLYANGWFASVRLPVPVVIVGNVRVGGGGKSPTVMALARHWSAQGRRVVIISRGYGRQDEAVMRVLPDSPVAQAGDEPLWLARQTGVPVFVAASRVDAARSALQACPDTELILADDGLQHLALQRDLEVLVFSDQGVGNGWLLPAGPLREPWPRPADLVLDTGACRRLTGTALSARGESIALATLATRPVLAVAAIANPQAFFDMLRAQGLTQLQCLALPDHDDFSSWPDRAKGLDSSTVVLCTEKDAPKLWVHVPDAWTVPMVLEPGSAFFERVDALLAQKTGRVALKLPHGSQID